MKLGILTLCCLLVQSTAVAGKWPRPAAGVSASGDPELLLTFDDGPHEKYTPIILDALNKHDVQAIFFWTGARVSTANDIEDRLAVVERTVRAGHLIGNHTISHAKLCSVSKAHAAAEIDENRVLYANLTGMPVPLFRVPYGARCKRLDAMLAERNLSHMHWDIDPQEWMHHSSDIAFHYVTTKLRRLEDGARLVLLMHDTKPATARAIPKILRWIDSENTKRRKRGRRPIRIVNGSQWYEEEHPVPLLRWTQSSAETAANGFVEAVRRLMPESG